MNTRVRLVEILFHMFLDGRLYLEMFDYWFHVIIAYFVLVIICGFLSMMNHRNNI